MIEASPNRKPATSAPTMPFVTSNRMPPPDFMITPAENDDEVHRRVLLARGGRRCRAGVGGNGLAVELRARRTLSAAKVTLLRVSNSILRHPARARAGSLGRDKRGAARAVLCMSVERDGGRRCSRRKCRERVGGAPQSEPRGPSLYLPRGRGTQPPRPRPARCLIEERARGPKRERRTAFRAARRADARPGRRDVGPGAGWGRAGTHGAAFRKGAARPLGSRRTAMVRTARPPAGDCQ